MRTLILPLFFAAALTAPAQRLSFGIKAGAPVTSAIPGDVSPYSIVDTGRWTVGPTAEVRLVGHLSFEFDALYRGYRAQSSDAAIIPSGTSLINVAAPGVFSSRQNTREWDFPLLLKYRFQTGPIHPFVDGGFEFAHTSSDYTLTCLASQDVCSALTIAAGAGTASVNPQSRYSGSVNRRGPAAGVGLEFKYGRLRIAPEVRYTRLTRPDANQVTVLAGFTF